MAEHTEKPRLEPLKTPKRVFSDNSITGGPPLHIPLASPVRPELELEGKIALSPTSSKAAKPPAGNLGHVSTRVGDLKTCRLCCLRW